MPSNDDPRRPLKLIKVGVFPPDEGSRTYMAYTRWYNPQWPRCCEHEVEAVNGTEAKKIANGLARAADGRFPIARLGNRP